MEDSYYQVTNHGNQGRVRNGSPIFYALLAKAARIHDKKSHDYASNKNPFANYRFAGEMSKLFDNPNDAGFVSRIAEKMFRLANIENSNKQALNESVEDAEEDLITIVVLWMASRRDERINSHVQLGTIGPEGTIEPERTQEDYREGRTIPGTEKGLRRD